MAKVLVSMKIFPSNVSINLDLLKKRIEEALPSYASVYSFDEEPVAFGLVVLIAHILLPEDRSGGMEEVESSLREIEEISQFETQMVRRV
ncbi:MAG: elongation factor 1-beta [Candidatus Bathyarchaeia archaeon]